MPVTNQAYQELKVTATPTVYSNVVAYVTINNASSKNLLVGAYLFPSKSLLTGATLVERPHAMLGCYAALVYPGTGLLCDATLRGNSNSWLEVSAILGHASMLPCTAELYSTAKLLTTASLASSTYEDFPIDARLAMGENLSAHVSISLYHQISATATFTLYQDIYVSAILATNNSKDFPVTATLRASSHKNLVVTATLKKRVNFDLNSHLSVKRNTNTNLRATANLFKNDNLKCKIEVKSIYKYLSDIKVVLVRTSGKKRRYITDVKTDSNGNFTFTNVPTGNYDIIAIDPNYYFLPLTYNTDVNENIRDIKIYAFKEYTTPSVINYTPKLNYPSGHTITGKVIYIDADILLFGCFFHQQDATRFINNFLNKKS